MKKPRLSVRSCTLSICYSAADDFRRLWDFSARRFLGLVKEPSLQPRPQFRDPIRSLRGNRHDLSIGKSLFERPQVLGRLGQIHLVCDHVPGPLRKPRIIEIDLTPQVLEIFDRMPAFASRDVEDEKQNPAASDVAKKIVTEADVAMRSFDQTGNVGNRRAAIFIETQPRRPPDEAW